MTENEEKILAISLRKAKIRERYKGVDQNGLDVIPAVPKKDLQAESAKMRVGAYVRVSTDDPRQTSSYELQKNHYEDLIARHPGWELADIYADEGISGTSLQHRDSFLRMISDCRDGKLDLIVTKSVSRFARNVVDCIRHVRELKSLRPPVGVLFEAESIYTLDSNSEMSLSFLSTLAQEESHNKSEIMNASIEMRFQRGIFLTPPLLGYDLDENGSLIINEDEAKTVRLAFFLYLYGYSSQKIAELFTALGRKTKRGNRVWSSGSILQILQNERHCGDVLARKTWTPNYLDHKAKKNRFDRNQYRQKNHHEAIISRDDFIAVQQMICNAKYGNRCFLPEVTVIFSDLFRGYVSINPRWAGFSADDYRRASAIAAPESCNPSAFSLIQAQKGAFDLRGFEIARAEFFKTPDKPSVTFARDFIRFNTVCLKNLQNIAEVELLVHPFKMLLAVRPCSSDCRNAIRWVSSGGHPSSIWCTAYISTLFALFGWNIKYRYQIVGQFFEKGEDLFLFFDMRDAKVHFPSSLQKETVGYPDGWASGFGDDYYLQEKERSDRGLSAEKWLSSLPAVPVKNEERNVTNATQVAQIIATLIEEMKEEVSDEFPFSLNPVK